MERKARLWDICISKNIFESCKESEINQIQQLFESVINENENESDIDMIELIKNKIIQKNSLNYQDLIPKPKQPIIDFRDNVEEEVIENMDMLIEQKTKERQLISDVSSNVILEHSNPIQHINSIQPNQIESSKLNEMISHVLYKMEKQDKILEQIIFSQIKIMEFLQKK
tara:strand:+ start:979 stop:1488 length:510 start_codon:yes stop_codon:yes gene_type:complete